MALRPGGLKKHVWRRLRRDLSTDRVVAAGSPPLGLLPKPRQAKIKEVTSAHHEDVGGIM